MILDRLTATQWIAVYASVVYIAPFLISLYLSIDFAINETPRLTCSFFINEYYMADSMAYSDEQMERLTRVYQECQGQSHPHADTLLNRSRNTDIPYLNKSA